MNPPDARPTLLLNSLPKSGTNLLARVLAGIPGYRDAGFIARRSAGAAPDPNSPYRVGVGDPSGIAGPAFEKLLGDIGPGGYALTHLPYSPASQALLERLGIRMILILRDPRDVVCSLAHYALKANWYRLHDYFVALPDVAARIRAATEGVPPQGNGRPGLLPLDERLRNFIGWLDWPGARLVLFEHLVGEAGGGSAALQRHAVEAVLDHAGIALDDAAKSQLCAGIFSADSPTFRKGQIGGWREHFTPELEAFFNEKAGESLATYLRLAAVA